MAFHQLIETRRIRHSSGVFEVKQRRDIDSHTGYEDRALQLRALDGLTSNILTQ